MDGTLGRQPDDRDWNSARGHSDRGLHRVLGSLQILGIEEAYPLWP
jgi:hypothetical protein